jgi:hypothetical protein
LSGSILHLILWDEKADPDWTYTDLDWSVCFPAWIF